MTLPVVHLPAARPLGEGPDPSGAGKAELRGMLPDELAEWVERAGERPFRAKQLFRWLHHKGAASAEEMSDLPKALREKLSREAQLETLALDAVQSSSDGTRKYRFRTLDGRFIESVYMPELPGSAAIQGGDEEEGEEPGEGAGSGAGAGAGAGAGSGSGSGAVPAGGRGRVRRTLCVSTQVGCAMGCRFCLTATMGLVRNLTAAEIVDQVYRVNADLRGLVARPGESQMDLQRPLTNLVYMGMGEPLHNFVHVKRSLDLLLHTDGANFSHRHVTVSTSGLVPNIQRLGEETPVKLAVSLNATTDEQRAALMPVDKKWSLAALLEACRRFPMKQGRRITFEYVLLRGVNDTDEDADRLAALLAGMAVKVNLIPYNENPGLGFGDPGAERVATFQRRLQAAGLTAPVRKSRGRDISAACGQLAVAGQRS